MKLITRTEMETTITSKLLVYENGQARVVDVEPVIIRDTKAITEKRANKILNIERGAAPYVDVQISTKETVYGIDFETFMAHANIITRPASQQRNKETE